MTTPISLYFGAFHLDLTNEQLWCDGQIRPLRPKAVAVLRILVEHAGQLVRKDAMFAAVWPDTRVSEAVLKTYIQELRTALGDDASAPRFVETIRRRGHRFIAPLTTAPPVQSSKFTVKRSDTRDSLLSSQLSLVVGREAELAMLHDRCARAACGERRCVFVTGEPGIGKTTLVETFLAQIGAKDWRLGDSI